MPKILMDFGQRGKNSCSCLSMTSTSNTTQIALRFAKKIGMEMSNDMHINKGKTSLVLVNTTHRYLCTYKYTIHSY